MLIPILAKGKEMVENIVTIHQGEPVVGSWNLSKHLEVEHRVVQRLIHKFKNDFEEMGAIAFFMQKPNSEKGGGVVKEFLLNEEQALYLTTLLSNSKKVREHKIKLTRQFVAQRKLIIKMQMLASVHKQNSDWLERRQAGKLERREETDKIKKFIEYAKSQGSKNADKYYAAITKMENAALFHVEILELEFPNLREIVNGFSLDALKMADHCVARSLEEGMERMLHYKEIYKLAKERVISFANAIGKIYIDQCILEQYKKQLA